MKMENQRLLIYQLDKKIKMLKKADESVVPQSGWIKAIRLALNMSLKQLSSRLNVSAQNINQLEKREKNGTITLNKLRETASALNMKFVYGFIPQEGSLEKMIEKRAIKIANEIVLRTSHSMKLEDQENLADRLKQAIKARADKIKNEMPKYLWD